MPVALNRKRVLWHSGLVVLQVAIAMLILRPVWVGRGWPSNDDDISPLILAETFHQAFRAHVWLPLWTPYAANGHGSAWPLFYHRLFSSCSGLLRFVWPAKEAVLVDIGLWMVVGQAGMARCVRRIGAGDSAKSFALQAWAGFVFATSHYAFFDWLIRGALAEFCAMMLVPHLIASLIDFKRQGKSTWLGVALTLLFFAHNMIALFAYLTVAVFVVQAWWARKGASVRELVPGAVIVILGCAPFAIAVAVLSKFFALDNLLVFRASLQSVSPLRYLLDDTLAWGHQSGAVSVEIGLPLLLWAIAGAVLAVRRTPRGPWRGELVALVICTAIYGLAQLPWAAPLFAAVTFLDLLQFPWRLLAFMTPLVIIIAALASARLFDAGRRLRIVSMVALAGIAVAQFVFAFQALALDYRWLSAEGQARMLEREGGPNGRNEYMVASAGRSPPPRTAFIDLGDCEWQQGAQSAEFPYFFSRIPIAVSSEHGCTLTVGQSASPLLRWEMDAGRMEEGRGVMRFVFPQGAHAMSVSTRGLLSAVIAGAR